MPVNLGPPPRFPNYRRHPERPALVALHWLNEPCIDKHGPTSRECEVLTRPSFGRHSTDQVGFDREWVTPSDGFASRGILWLACGIAGLDMPATSTWTREQLGGYPSWPEWIIARSLSLEAVHSRRSPGTFGTGAGTWPLPRPTPELSRS